MQNSENCDQQGLLKILEQYRQKAHRKVSVGGSKKTKFNVSHMSVSHFFFFKNTAS